LGQTHSLAPPIFSVEPSCQPHSSLFQAGSHVSASCIASWSHASVSSLYSDRNCEPLLFDFRVPSPLLQHLPVEHATTAPHLLEPFLPILTVAKRYFRQPFFRHHQALVCCRLTASPSQPSQKLIELEPLVTLSHHHIARLHPLRLVPISVRARPVRYFFLGSKLFRSSPLSSSHGPVGNFRGCRESLVAVAYQR
jgi:hypothetical protein